MDDRCHGPNVPRRSHVKENTVGGGGADNGSREKEGKEKSGQKHRSKHLKDH